MKTFLKARWENIVMANYQVDDATLMPYLPYGVELDKYEDKTYVSLVGFRFIQSAIFGIPIPFWGSFDEVNLRFYVKRNQGAEVKRGVVFISEVVPYKIVSILANLLYKEHYSAATMQSKIEVENDTKKLSYKWQLPSGNYSLQTLSNNTPATIVPGSLEEFIYEHYYGYTKASQTETWEYKVNHPRWQTNTVKQATIDCDFEKMYGANFAFLNKQKPYSIYNALGSEVSIDWGINKLIEEK